MDAIHFLNLEYLLLALYGILVNIVAWFNPGQLSLQTLTLAIRIAWTGLGIAFFTFCRTFVFNNRRLREVQKEGWHKRHADEEKRSKQKAAVAPKNAQWDRVVLLANSGEESDWRRAILEADIMLGNILQIRGYRGQTIGDMLKTANPIQFTTLDLAWKAHKVRNDIAHGGESFTLTGRETRATIDMFRARI